MLAGDLGMTLQLVACRCGHHIGKAMLRFMIIAVALTLVASSPALANGGTIRRSEPVPTELTTPSLPQASSFDNLGGCGRGRYRDPATHRCRGPADFGN
jgi:hypothetical protein